jgi:GTPase
MPEHNPASSQTGPWAGYESLDAAIQGLRRARFRLEKQYTVTGRGVVIDGTLETGSVTPGMVLLVPARDFPNVLVELRIGALEESTRSGFARLALILGDVLAGPGELVFEEGTVLDILERSPAA